MIRKAILKDVNSIEDTYNEHFQYELNHTAFTVFKKGVYPTKDDAERAIYAGALFVYEEHRIITVHNKKTFVWTLEGEGIIGQLYFFNGKDS